MLHLTWLLSSWPHSLLVNRSVLRRGGKRDGTSALDLYLCVSLASSFTLILHLSLNLSLSPSLLWHTSRLKLGWKNTKKKKKHNDLTIDFLFPYHLRLLPFAIRQDPNDFHSLSPPLPSSSRLRHPAILPALLHFFSGAFFPFSFFCCVLLALNWNSALWNGKVIYIDSSGLFGCRSYPEPLVMLLETWQQ